MDFRNIKNGYEIPRETYADQPYITKTDDGAWLCCLTTGGGHEGDCGQHVITSRSTDMGKTWSDPVDVEPSDGPEASYAAMLKVLSGRIYIFYNHNTDNIRKVPADTPSGHWLRVDSLGYFVFKYSDDHGRTWSKKRYNIPVREFECDRNNNEQGRVRYFWNVGKPFVHNECGYVPHIKVGRMGVGFFSANEGVLLASKNILTETDPEKIIWQTLPDGKIGLRTPPGGGPVASEQSFCVLSDGSFYCVYRSIDGYPVCTYSRDGGHTWNTPEYKKYADGRFIKNPRAANFAWKCSNGKYLYWFHNHGGKFISEMLNGSTGTNGLSEYNECTPYDDRNPVWMCGGVEADSPEGKVIKWSQPEIVLYDDDPYIRMSYPDMIEEGGRIFLTETQKNIARVHEIPKEIIEGLWNQLDQDKEVAIVKDGLITDLPANSQKIPHEITSAKLPSFNQRDLDRHDYGCKDLRNGFTVEMCLAFKSLDKGQAILDNRTAYGQGFCVQTIEKGAIEIILNDGRTENRWKSDPDMLTTEKEHYIGIVVDGGPKIISFIIDGKFCDGGDYRQFGWGRFSPNLRGENGGKYLKIGSEFDGLVKMLRIYDRSLKISEVIQNFKAQKLIDFNWR